MTHPFYGEETDLGWLPYFCRAKSSYAIDQFLGGMGRGGRVRTNNSHQPSQTFGASDMYGLEQFRVLACHHTVYSPGILVGWVILFLLAP